MKNTQHTRGPWAVHTRHSRYHFPRVQVYSISKKYICELPDQTGDTEPPEFDKSMRKSYYDDPDDAAQNLANAHLIASAPDLLDLLEAAVARVQLANEDGNPILSAWLPAALSTLRKAKGEA